MTIQELARQYADMFITAQRDNEETYLTLRDSNDNLMSLIRDAHGDMMPDDFKYQFIHEALEAIAETDDIDDINLEPDCYNRDLVKWVSSNLIRASAVDEAVENYSYKCFYSALRMGQSAEKEEVLYFVRSSLESILGE
jgi:hypothetical protein